MKKGKTFGEFVSAHRPHLYTPKRTWPRYAGWGTVYLATKATTLTGRLIAGAVRETYYALTPEQMPSLNEGDTQELYDAICATGEVEISRVVDEILKQIPQPLSTYRKIITELITPDLTPPTFPDHPTPVSLARWRDRARWYLNNYHYGSLERTAAPILKVFKEVGQYLPPPSTSALRIPIIDLIPDIPKTIEAVILPFYEDELFSSLKERLDANACDDKGNLILPTKAKAPTIETYLKGTPLLQLFKARIPFSIPRKKFEAHGIIIAPPNHGKSQLLSTFIHRFLTDTEETGIIVLDPHGDLFNSLKGRTPTERTIILDPSTNPPPLNFFDFGNASDTQILQTFTYLMSSLSGGMTDKQGAIVPYLLKLLKQIPGASLETLRLIVDEKVKRIDQSAFASAILTLPIIDQGFFHNQFYSQSMQVTKDAIGWKLYSALSSDAFRTMFSAKTNSFDASAALKEKKIVLVKGSESVLGEHGLPVFLQFIVSQFFLAALKREAIPKADRHLCLLFADEASHIFNHQTTRILTECRKYGLGFLGATQLVEQIPIEVKAAIYGATSVKIAGPVSYESATVLSRAMNTSPEMIRGLQSYEGKSAEWAMYVQNTTKTAVKVTVPFGALDSLPHYPLPKEHKVEEPPRQKPQSPPPRTPRQRFTPR